MKDFTLGKNRLPDCTLWPANVPPLGGGMESKMLYPIKFNQIYKDYIWGGRNLERFGKTLPPEGRVAESWELSSHKNGVSVAANGLYSGKTLPELIQILGAELLGTDFSPGSVFPLLVKLIDAKENLSVQVHPSDDYAFKFENGELGKNEMWYILYAEAGAKLVAGVAPGITKEKFEQALKDNTLEACLNYLPVRSGDCVNIPAGMVHAIGKGIVLAEVQQASDLTYRVYDYNRVGADGRPRALHAAKSLEVIDFSIDSSASIDGVKLVKDGVTVNIKIANRYFTVEVIDIDGGVYADHADGTHFLIYTAIHGRGSIAYNGGACALSMGETVLIPANMGKYNIGGGLRLIKSYVPNLRRDIVDKLGKQVDLTNIEGLKGEDL